MNFIQKYFLNKKFEEEAILKSKTEAEQLEIVMTSDIPWYKLVGDAYDIEKPPVDAIQDRYLWNKAFIKSLREAGHLGETDAEVISKWEVHTATEKLNRLIKLQKETRKSSNEPWVEILSEEYDESTQQVSMTLDWNKAFVKMLRSNGYVGVTEQEIVDKWFKRLSETIAAENALVNYE